jgi:hypothetical protein
MHPEIHEPGSQNPPWVYILSQLSSTHPHYKINVIIILPSTGLVRCGFPGKMYCGRQTVKWATIQQRLLNNDPKQQQRSGVLCMVRSHGCGRNSGIRQATAKQQSQFNIGTAISARSFPRCYKQDIQRGVSQWNRVDRLVSDCCGSAARRSG